MVKLRIMPGTHREPRLGKLLRPRPTSKHPGSKRGYRHQPRGIGNTTRALTRPMRKPVAMKNRQYKIRLARTQP